MGRTFLVRPRAVRGVAAAAFETCDLRRQRVFPGAARRGIRVGGDPRAYSTLGRREGHESHATHQFFRHDSFQRNCFFRLGSRAPHNGAEVRGFPLGNGDRAGSRVAGGLQESAEV